MRWQLTNNSQNFLTTKFILPWRLECVLMHTKLKLQVEMQPRFCRMIFYSLALLSDNCFCYPISQMQTGSEVIHTMLIFLPHLHNAYILASSFMKTVFTPFLCVRKKMYINNFRQLCSKNAKEATFKLQSSMTIWKLQIKSNRWRHG